MKSARPRRAVRAGRARKGHPTRVRRRPRGPGGTPTHLGEAIDQGTVFAGRTDGPPGAWGGPLDPPRSRPPAGRTPTCVGRARRRCRTRRWWSKDPHVRGENRSGCSTNSVSDEGPPHAWGALRVNEFLEVPVGRTPMCVGSTLVHHGFCNGVTASLLTLLEISTCRQLPGRDCGRNSSVRLAGFDCGW